MRPTQATVQIRSTKGGRAGFAWQLDGQKDFPSKQIIRLVVPASGDWQEVRAELPAEGQIIHLRVLLPDGTTDIRRISLSNKNSDF